MNHKHNSTSQQSSCINVLDEIHTRMHGRHVQADMTSFTEEGSDAEVIILIAKVMKNDANKIYDHIKKASDDIMFQIYGAADETVKQ